MIASDIAKLFQIEIDRCVEEQRRLGPDETHYREGFVAGLLQAKTIVHAAIKVEVVSIPHLGPVA